MTTPRERIAKGSNLEKAVQLIEDAILGASPALKDKAFTIERNKIIAVAGVHHEIDVWVEIDAGKGYKAVFIFECKNWQDKVGKNEIIVFSEKIKAARAEKGFFVAASFTSDAEAQSKSDPRMELLIAREASTLFSLIPVPVSVVILKVERTHLSLGADVPMQERTLENASCTHRGEVTTLAECNEKWVNEAVGESRPRIIQEVDQAVRAGKEAPRTVKLRKELTFQPGELVVEGINIRNARLDVEIQADVTPTRVVFQYEVETRGWAVSWEPVRRTTPVVEGIELLDVSFATTELLSPKRDKPAE